MLLVNRINKQILREKLRNESFNRRTLSFYRYINIQDTLSFRDALYQDWYSLNCFGRVYIAHEGINAQMSVPEHHLQAFLGMLEKYKELEGMPIKYAIEDNGKSFYKLTVKVRPKIVADGLDDGTYDMSSVGKHLEPLEFHQALNDENTLIVDMRNHYESEIGKFENAYCPDADKFKDALHMVAQQFNQDKDRKILLYCTGGIRCEKASSFLIQRGFSNVFQLSGGIIAYAQQVKEQQLSSKFIGKNFVFDERLGESVDGQVISHCHQCGKPCDTHTNCSNDDCHMLFIQCADCRQQYDGCCSHDCQSIRQLPLNERNKFKVLRRQKYARSKIFTKFG